MKREEIKQLNENKKALELTIKNNSKLYGYKTISGLVYKIINDFIFIISISVSNKNKNITVSIQGKPIILDKIFWEIFDMAGEIKNKPVSFHVNGVFTAKTMEINKRELNYNKKEEAEIKFEEIINYSNNIIEQYKQKIDGIDSFYESIINDSEQYLNIILIDIIKSNYEKALDKINFCIRNNKDGGFMNENYKSIILCAKEYCEKRI
ncbi:MAG: hypothetical protein LBK13_05390 [Spirochaetales bacterium]|jgi:hypothetical protein|nr:hypothetical protein [Spirochaetales bacterium]